MFTGIIEAVGTVRRVRDLDTIRRFEIETPLGAEVTAGDSVSVDGACLTVVEASVSGFSVDVIGTTLERTIAGAYADGVRVNLERAMSLGDRLNGHLVQGHVDAVGRFIQSVRYGEYWLMDFELPPVVADQTVGRGSIAINGVSLTVSGFETAEVCRIGVIPVTHQNTNLGDLRAGAAVNLEGDLIGKYVGRMLAARED